LSSIKYGVIAGTPFDTELGARFFNEKGKETVSAYISKTPDIQNNLQYTDPQKLEIITLETIEFLKEKGAEVIIIYCNSLSSVLNLSKIRGQSRIPVITPLDVYQDLKVNTDKLAVLAANAQSAANIENIISKNYQALEFITAGIMPIINAVEKNIDPEIIFKELGLYDLLFSFKKMGAEAVLLGCTHLPYLKKEISSIFDIVIDPTDKLIELAE